jgi:hypothetical protein
LDYTFIEGGRNMNKILEVNLKIAKERQELFKRRKTNSIVLGVLFGLFLAGIVILINLKGI